MISLAKHRPCNIIANQLLFLPVNSSNAFMLVVNHKISIPLREFSFTFSRSSGPGGQNVNKVNTKATLRWPIAKTTHLPDGVRERFVSKYARRITSDGDLVITSQRFRDQGRNVADCLSKLRQMLENVADQPKQRKPTRRTRASKERRLNAKRRQSEKIQRRKLPRDD